MRLNDALVSIYQEYPTYKMEKIASTHPSTQSIFKEPDSS